MNQEETVKEMIKKAKFGLFPSEIANAKKLQVIKIEKIRDGNLDAIIMISKLTRGKEITIKFYLPCSLIPLGYISCTSLHCNRGYNICYHFPRLLEEIEKRGML